MGGWTPNRSAAHTASPKGKRRLRYAASPLAQVMEEAGFRNATVYWEGTDEDGDGNGEFSRETRGEADAGWIAYIVAEK
jgi:hypothetical protein